MDDTEKRIEEIEKEIRETPYHKGTEHYIGKLRAKLAKLKDQIVEREGKKGSRSAGGQGFAVKQQGDATVVLVGFPSVGKSTLLNKLTNAQSRVAPYEFTTITVIPGMMQYKGAKLQILDVPGLVEGASRGRGRGREVLSVVRAANLLIIIAEAGKEDVFEKIDKELYENGVRVNKAAPKVVIKKTAKGGLGIRSTVSQDFRMATAGDAAREFGYTNAEIVIQEKLTLDELIDAFSRNRIYIPVIYVVNKIDKVWPSFAKASEGKPAVKISAETGIGLEALKEKIWEKLGLVRVYLRRHGGPPDYNDPVILGQNRTLSNVLEKIGARFAQDKSGARIWGPGAKFPGQKVSLSTSACDRMEVMFI